MFSGTAEQTEPVSSLVVKLQMRSQALLRNILEKNRTKSMDLLGTFGEDYGI
jgi:hypothetical protein